MYNGTDKVSVFGPVRSDPVHFFKKPERNPQLIKTLIFHECDDTVFR
jgi:hypothetical protein